LSSLLRGDAVALLDHRLAGGTVTMPRVFGTRVLRGDRVGLQQPMPLAAPVVSPSYVSGESGSDVVEAYIPPAPDLAEVQEAARLEGYNNGFEEGRAAGLAAADAATAESVQRLSELVSAVHESHATFFRSAERQVVDLALQIAQKVVEREVENIPDLAVNVIRAALEEMDARTAVRVRVSPDDQELVRRRWTQIIPPGISPDRIELQQDERVQSGGAIIETTQGQVDVQLESKLAQLGNALWTFVMDVSTSQPKDADVDA
jgi:flagellar biosynthesis/type III secretory pathway protein FliH